MEIVTVRIPVRGKEIEIEVPGGDADPTSMVLAQLEMMALALLALEDPKVDAVLRGFGFRIEVLVPDSDPIVIAPDDNAG